MKRFLLAAGAALALAVAAPTMAGAAPHGHGHGWVGHGGWHHHGGGWRGPAFGLGMVAPYAAYNSCYDVRPIWRHGHRVWRRVWVC